MILEVGYEDSLVGSEHLEEKEGTRGEKQVQDRTCQQQMLLNRTDVLIRVHEEILLCLY